jgi:hypothetical protein
LPRRSPSFIRSTTTGKASRASGHCCSFRGEIIMAFFELKLGHSGVYAVIDKLTSQGFDMQFGTNVLGMYETS